MKKFFEQPELMVVRINKNDIIATSDLQYGDEVLTGTKGNAGERRFDFDNDWDAGY